MRAAWQPSRAGVRALHPEATEDEIRLRLLALRLDRETMVKYVAWDPELESC
jgi:hypothetical protein